MREPLAAVQCPTLNIQNTDATRKATHALVTPHPRIPARSYIRQPRYRGNTVVAYRDDNLQCAFLVSKFGIPQKARDLLIL